MTKKTSPATTDLKAIKDLVLWARRERIAVDALTVGTISMQFRDLALGGPATTQKSDAEAASTIYEKYGKALFEQADPADGAFDSVLEEDAEEIADA